MPKSKRTRRSHPISRAEKSERVILWISFFGGALFALVEFISSIYTHSQSVLMDAAYDASELIIIILTLFLTPLFHQPASEKHPYGFTQVESIFVIIKSFMMLSVSLGLSFNFIEQALNGGNPVNGTQISLLQLVLGLASLAFFLVMRSLNHSLSSPTVRAELLGWKLDVAYSLGLSLAFFASNFLELTPLAFLSPYFDQIVAALIVLFTLPENLKMLSRAIQDVFLFAPGEEIIEAIKETCGGILDQHGFEPVFYDVTRTGRRLWVSIYYRIEGDTLSLPLLHQVNHEIQEALEARFESCSSELIEASGISFPIAAQET